MEKRDVKSLGDLGYSPTALGFVLSMENRGYWGSVLARSIGYLLITLLLNSIRGTASLWIVWPLIVVQLAFYCSVFVAGYRRTIVMGLNNTLATITFVSLALLGRMNTPGLPWAWEIVILPLVIVVTLGFSAKNKLISQSYLATMKARREAAESSESLS